jgi:hypothetical protein
VAYERVKPTYFEFCMAVNREVAVVIYQKVRGWWAREVGGPSILVA